MSILRRSLPAAAAAALLIFAVSCGSVPSPAAETASEPSESWSGSPVVLTRAGAVRGYEDADQTWVWRGIPFAKPPVGELRWRAPQDPEPWDGILEARSFGPACTQYRPLLGGISGAEDCLTLNVWRPRSTETGLPIYVWIHGGGNSIGSSAMAPDYYGNRLASISRMVFVSVNYRLGPLGWFRHPALAEGATAEDGSGNYGTLDLIHALKWVRSNAHAFGGDPARVLIAGESAGAMNVMSLLISAQARGLFSHALVQSGAAVSRTTEDAERSSSRVLETLLVRDRKAKDLEAAAEVVRGMGAQEIRSYLRSTSDREILRCYSGAAFGMISNPAILRDGVVLPREGFRVLDSGGAAAVPLMIGSNKEETKLFLLMDAKLRRKRELYAAVARWGSDSWKAEGVDGVARRISGAEGAPPVYAYHFHWGAKGESGKSPLPGAWGARLGAFHSLEIPFFLGPDTLKGSLYRGLFFTPANQAGRAALSGAMMRYVSSFVRSGDPNLGNAELPRWEPWRNGELQPKSIIFDVRGDFDWIRMTQAELTRDGVKETMRQELAGDLYERAAAYVERFSPVIVSD